MKSIASALLFLILSCGCHAAEKVQFIDHIGEFPIQDTDEKILITKENEQIQFRIRESGPVDPAIRSESDWFVAVVDKDHIWVHLGGGRLFYYTWESENRSRVDEWTYPRIGNAKLPQEVKKRLSTLQAVIPKSHR